MIKLSLKKVLNNKPSSYNKMVLEELKDKAINAFAKATGLGFDDSSKLLENAFIKGLDADLGFPCFRIANQFGKTSDALANELAVRISKLLKDKEFSKVAAINGYVNFYYNWELLSCLILKAFNNELQSKVLKHKRLTHKKPIIVEFSSPNTNKPLHLGHVRNNCLGDAISRLLEFQGFKVLRTNLINDRGIHICKAMVAYELFGNNLTPQAIRKKPDHFVGYYYSMFNQKAKYDEHLDTKAQEMLKKWESGDKQVLKTWKRLRSWALRGLIQTYNNYGVRFDIIEYESRLYKKGKELVLDGLKRGLFFKDDSGAIVARFGNLPEKVLLRSDATSIYITQDIGLAVFRKQKYDFKSTIYVVGREQELHFKQLFKSLKLLGFDWAKDLKHLSYGMVLLKHGKMKSREGNVIEADDFLSQIQELAIQELKKRQKGHNDLSNLKNLKRRARAIALAAIKFYMLKYTPKKDFVFKPEESISFEGETGPYIQYTIARINSLLRKAIEKKVKIKSLQCYASDFKSLELGIIKQLALFRDVVNSSANTLNPAILCKYLILLAQNFNKLYQTTPFLRANNNELQNRLLIALNVKRALSKGLDLLNIPILEEM